MANGSVRDEDNVLMPETPNIVCAILYDNDNVFCVDWGLWFNAYDFLEEDGCSFLFL